MKKEWRTVQELAAELRMSQKSTQCACRKREIRLLALSLLHLDTSD